MKKRQLELCLVTVIAVSVGETRAGAQAPAPASPPAAAPQGQPAAPAPGQHPAAQSYPGQPYPAQPYPGQPYPAQPYPAQPYPAQPYPGQPYPAQPYSGQPYPAQPYPGQPYPAQPYPGQPYPGQPYPGQPPANLNTTLHLDSSDQEATVFQNTGSSAFVGYAYRGAFVGQIDFWNRICRAPCDQPVDSNGTYSIRGNGIVPSAPFSLPRGAVRVNAQVGHVGPRIGGLMLTALGGGTLVGGATLLGISALFSSFSTDSSLGNTTKSYNIAGGVMLGIGAAALAGGIVLLVKTRTRVQINGQTVARLPLLSGGRPLYVSANGLRF